MTRTRPRWHGSAVLVALSALLSVGLPSPAHAAGWSPVLTEEFNSFNSNRWGAYSGQPGGNPYGMWSPRHIVTSGGVTRLRGYREGSRFVTAGMMLNAPRLYGKFVVRARFDRGVGIEHTFLLWPTNGSWPPEVDFSEGSAASSRTMITSHWSSNNTQVHRYIPVDMTAWHNYGVEWTSTRLLFTIDGRAVATLTGSAVPHTQMRLALQTAATRAVGAPSTSTPREVTLYVASVSVSRPS